MFNNYSNNNNFRFVLQKKFFEIEEALKLRVSTGFCTERTERLNPQSIDSTLRITFDVFIFGETVASRKVLIGPSVFKEKYCIFLKNLENDLKRF